MEQPATLLTEAPTHAALLALRAPLDERINALSESLAKEQNDARLGAAGATERAADIRQKIAELAAERTKLQGRIDAAQHQEAVARTARLQARQREGRVELSQLMRNQLLLARKAQDAAETLGQTMRDMQANGVRLGQIAGHPEAWRLFGPLGPLISRIRLSFFRTFDATETNPNRHQGMWIPPATFFLTDVGNATGEAALKKTLPEREADTLDALPVEILWFETKAEAEEARDRRDPSRADLHVLEDDGLYRIVPGRLQGVAARQTHQPDAAA
jgi:hypothetical protein